MTDQNDDVLRRSLDAVDRHRNRLLFGLAAVIVLLLFFLVHTMIGGHGDMNNAQAILAHYFILLIWVTGLAVMIVVQVATMTKRILRAIELAAKRERE